MMLVNIPRIIFNSLYFECILKNIVFMGAHNEELHNLYSSSNIIRMVKSRRMRQAGPVTNGANRNACGKVRRKRPLGRPRRRRVNNVKNGSYRDTMGWYGLDRPGSG
jgi:hypothetical protein